jgi:hypothetical protein
LSEGKTTLSQLLRRVWQKRSRANACSRLGERDWRVAYGRGDFSAATVTQVHV